MPSLTQSGMFIAGGKRSGSAPMPSQPAVIWGERCLISSNVVGALEQKKGWDIIRIRSSDTRSTTSYGRSTFQSKSVVV